MIRLTAPEGVYFNILFVFPLILSICYLESSVYNASAFLFRFLPGLGRTISALIHRRDIHPGRSG